MSAIESLSNPLERLAVLPTAVNARPSAPADITWDSAIQYFKNDLVISPLTGGAYVFTGGANDLTAIRGGSDPASSADWTRLQGNGASEVSIYDFAADITSSTAYTLPAGATLTGLPAGSTWNVIFDGQTTTSAPAVANDQSTWIFTAGGGAGANSVAFTSIASVGASLVNFGFSGVVTVGAGGGSITPTASANGAAQTLKAGSRITYVRLA